MWKCIINLEVLYKVASVYMVWKRRGRVVTALSCGAEGRRFKPKTGKRLV